MIQVLLIMLAMLPQDESLLEKFEKEVEGVVIKGKPSLVSITAHVVVNHHPQFEERDTLSLSGVVYRKEGYIVTSSAFLGDAAQIRVRLMDQQEVDASFVGFDPKTRITVLQVKAEDLHPVEIGPVSEIRTGAIGIALGNPFGLSGAAAMGYVCGQERSIQVGGRRFDRMLQLSTPIYPGDVGGIVVDSRGRLMGVLHSAYRTGTDLDLSSLFRQLRGKHRNSRWEGFSFATPVDRVCFVADRIIKHGRMIRGWMGVSVVLKKKKRIEVSSVVENGPAQKAGLQAGDVLVSFDGARISNLSDFQDRVEEISEPREVSVVYRREGAEHTAHVKIEIESGGR